MNKKIVIIVVLVECVLAVLLISFFGQAIYNSSNKIECNEIYFCTEDGVKYEDDFVIEVELSDTQMSYKLFVAIAPKNATNKKLEFISSKEGVIVDESGEVTFLTETPVIITVKTLDGSNKMDTIRLVPKRKSDGPTEVT